MKDRPIRRVVMVLAVYVAVAAVILPATDWARRLFALPGLFADLVRVGLAAGLPFAAILAWKYPTLGQEPRTGRDPIDVRGDNLPEA
jgi:hypothetical protein